MLIDGVIRLENQDDLEILQEVVNNSDKVVVILYDNNENFIIKGTRINVYSNLALINIDLSTPAYTRIISMKTENIKYIELFESSIIESHKKNDKILYINIILSK